MNIWHQYPFFRLIVPFGAGIWCGIYMPEFHELQLLLVFLAAAFIPVIAAHFIRSYSFRWIPGVVIFLFAFAGGVALTLVNTPKNNPGHFNNEPASHPTLLLRILEPPLEKTNSYRSIVEAEAMIDSAGRHAVTGKSLVYFAKDEKARQLSYGDLLLTGAQPKPVPPPANPYQFDYAGFLSHEGIYHQLYLRGDQWIRIDSGFVNPVFAFAHHLRRTMLGVLEDNGLQGPGLAVTAAILLGYDEYMEPELRDRYAAAGAMHVLCVSGLHVGIIFFILSFLLKGLDRRRSTRILKMLLLLFSIWIYALITGLSPSVMRAGVMFSLFAWREVRKEKSNPYNILAASAFILLLADPFLITRIGFQLSYAAVLAIIALFDPIYKLLVVKNTIGDYLWKLTAVSLAAQIGTFPLVIYYFNQFPTYFFITNLVVIPLVWLLVNTGIIVLATAFVWHVLSVKVTMLLYLQAYLLNFSVDAIQSLPGARIGGLVLSLPQVVMLYAIIVFITQSLLHKKTAWLTASLSVMLLLAGTFVVQRYERLQQEKIVVYNINRHSAIDLVWGPYALFLSDSSLRNDARNLDFNISQHRVHAGISDVETSDLHPGSIREFNPAKVPVKFHNPQFMQFAGRRMVIVDDAFGTYQPAQPLHADIVLLRNNPETAPEHICRYFSFDVLVADASNSYYTVRKFGDYCRKHNLAFHDVRNQGAFVVENQSLTRQITKWLRTFVSAN